MGTWDPAPGLRPEAQLAVLETQTRGPAAPLTPRGALDGRRPGDQEGAWGRCGWGFSRPQERGEEVPVEGPQRELWALGSGFCVAFIPEPRMPASVGDRSLEVLIQPCPSPKNLKSQPSPWGGRVAICAIPLFLLLGSVLSTAQGAKPIPSLLGP